MRYGPPASRGKFDKSYVSEFTDFITHFLEDHPEEEEERRKGRALYWDHKPDAVAQDQGERDNVPDDRYGFDYSAWRPRDTGQEGGPQKG